MSDIALRRKVAEATNRVVKARGIDVEGLGEVCAALGDLLGAWTGQEVRILIHAESQSEGIDMSKRASDDPELLRHALDALEHHREQTRPIGRCDSVIERLRARLGA